MPSKTEKSKSISVDTENLLEGVERIEIDIRQFLPLFYKKRNLEKVNSISSDVKNIITSIETLEINIRPFLPLFFNQSKLENTINNQSGNAARFMYQKYLETSNDKMISTSVMQVFFEGKFVDVDFTFFDKNKGEGIIKPRNKHLNDFRLYKAFSEKKKLDELSRNDGIKVLDTQVSFSYIMDLMNDTINESIPVKECMDDPKRKREFRIIYYNENTGWKCVFNGKKGSKKLTLTTFCNNFIPESAKEVDVVDWFNMAIPIRNAARLLTKELHYSQTDKAVRDYFSGRTINGDERESIWLEEVVGNLHDAIEDTKYDVKQVMQMFQERCNGQLRNEDAETIQEALNLLNSKTASSREEYINRFCQSENKVAVNVKLNDLQHNMDISRIENPTKKDFKRIERYKKEYEQIKSIRVKNGIDKENF